MRQSSLLSFTANVGTIAQLGGQAFAKIRIKYTGNAQKGKAHLVLVLDCSGSMWDQIEKLREDVKKFVNGLKPGTLISIIVFSGHSESRTIIGATDCTDAGKQKLCTAVENNVRVMGCTVFSEALQTAVNAVEEAKGTINHMAVLFTDGCPVPTRWSEQEEIAKAVSQVQTMRGKGIGLSCLGYGPHYNGDFLSKLMNAGGNNGVLEHMDIVGGKLSQLVAKILDITTRTQFGKVEFSVKNGGNAFKVTPQASPAGVSGNVSFNGLLDGEATVFVELSSGAQKFDITGTFNGQDIRASVVADSANSETSVEFVVGKAAVAMTNGKNKEAAELFAVAGMENLSNRAKASNTPTEKRRFAGTMRYYYINRDWIGAGLKDQGPNRCGVNAMRLIAEGCDAGQVVIRVDRYRRTGKKVIKKGVVSGKGNPIMVTKVTSHDYRMNFGFTTKDEGAKVATDGGFKSFDDFKTYLVIADGEYHDAQFSASFTQESWFTKLQEAGVLAKEAKYKIGQFYTLLFNEDLPMVSSNFARPSSLGLVPLLMEEAELEAKQKALNARIKALQEEGAKFTPAPKQGEDETLAVDTYEAICCEYKLMKYKAPAAPDYSSLNYEEALKERTTVKRRLNQVRFMYRTIRAACELTGSEAIEWGAEESRANSKKTIQKASFDGAVLQRDRWTELVEFS